MSSGSLSCASFRETLAAGSSFLGGLYANPFNLYLMHGMCQCNSKPFFSTQNRSSTYQTAHFLSCSRPNVNIVILPE
jgi:hypothetical protein